MSTSALALILLAALVAWTAFLAPVRTSAIIVQPRATPQTDRSLPTPHRSSASRARIATRGSDVVQEDYPLDVTFLSSLQTGDRIALPHPDGGRVELRVERTEAQNGIRHLRLADQGLVSTITEAGGAFFGTLATPRGVYALEGDGRGSRLTRHAALDQRMNSHALDYRHAPSS